LRQDDPVLPFGRSAVVSDFESLEMDVVTFAFMASGDIYCTVWPHREEEPDTGFSAKFTFGGRHDERSVIRTLDAGLAHNEIDWLVRRGRQWILDGEKLRRWMSQSGGSLAEMSDRISWMTGAIPINPELSLEEAAGGVVHTAVRFNVFQEEYIMATQTRVFLSHKGADKPMVERFFATLSLLGFDPWLDKEDMPGGTELHRGILQGFKDSCAVVFFITPKFKDEAYLRNEINYAVQEKTEKGDRFSIITLMFKDENGKEGVVPDLLRSYVWKHPADELEALREIIRGLPIEVGPIAWKDGK
jgi:hypothetical protein